MSLLGVFGGVRWASADTAVVGIRFVEPRPSSPAIHDARCPNVAPVAATPRCADTSRLRCLVCSPYGGDDGIDQLREADAETVILSEEAPRWSIRRTATKRAV
jgi:hypothetical protein